jgi:methylphosphotriester-DNA--protein-cysteine methyltransferase
MKKIRISVSIIVLVVFSVICLAFAADYKYVGSSKSNKYHYPTCQLAGKIKLENLVTFKSVKETLAALYIPCKVCKPPIKD